MSSPPSYPLGVHPTEHQDVTNTVNSATLLNPLSSFPVSGRLALVFHRLEGMRVEQTNHSNLLGEDRVARAKGLQLPLRHMEKTRKLKKIPAQG